MNVALAEWYANTRGVRALVQLIGVGGAADTLIMDNLERYRAERARVFFDELAKGDHLLTDDLIRSEDFLHAYFATSRAALNTKRRGKIRLFAQLLLSGVSGNASLKLDDEYEEYLKILDELSSREIQLLTLLLQYEKQYPRGSSLYENEYQRAGIFWNNYLADVQEKLDIPVEEINPMMFRLVRTGVYETFQGVYIDAIGAIGQLTQIFYKLSRAIQLDPNKN